MSQNKMNTANITEPQSTDAYIAVSRFGYGAKGNELKQAAIAPRKWVSSQLSAVKLTPGLPTSDDVFNQFSKYRALKKKAKENSAKSMQKQEKIKNNARTTLLALSSDSVQQAISSSNSISWRLFDFFSNHFSVTATNGLMVGLAPTLEREAIAPNLFNRFEDMLLAVESHPAMLIYLNNERSFGPDSRLAKKRKVGLNENLAREILELHTLGVNSGYTQTDVLELAKGITGWSVKNPQKEKSTGFIFRSFGHQPGKRTLLGKQYPQKGVEQGIQMLRDLANHPKTAHHICTKLAQHFVSATPPANLISKMEATWQKTSGNIKQVMLTMLNADEAWLDSPSRFKSPREFVISSLRALNLKKIPNKHIIYSLTQLGQKPFSSGSPAGFSNDENDWLGASALMARLDWSTLLVKRQKRTNSEAVMARTLGKSVSQQTYQTVMRAESRDQSMVLFLMSPEFQRR